MEMRIPLWADFKTDVIAKGFSLNFYTARNPDDGSLYGYEVFAIDRTIVWSTTVHESTDIADFETNYKSNANKNLAYDSEGHTIQSPKSKETQIFTDVAIRDVISHTSDTVSNEGYRVKTIIISNQLNQAVTLTFQASRDSVSWFNVCEPFTIDGTVLTFQTCETYFPYNRCLAQCTVAPTTGLLNAWCEKMGT